MMVLQSCKSLEIKDTTHCAVAGVVDAGGDCVTLISGKQTSLTFDELIALLESGAIITPVDDFVSVKEELEQACILLKNRCTKEIKKNIELMNKNLYPLLIDKE